MAMARAAEAGELPARVLPETASDGCLTLLAPGLYRVSVTLAPHTLDAAVVRLRKAAHGAQGGGVGSGDKADGEGEQAVHSWHWVLQAVVLLPGRALGQQVPDYGDITHLIQGVQHVMTGKSFGDVTHLMLGVQHVMTGESFGDITHLT